MKLSRRSRLLARAVAIMAAVALVAAGVTSVVLYDAAFCTQERRLVETVTSQARLLEAIARHGHSQEETLARFMDAQHRFEGLAATGEFTLGRRDGDRIEFILRSRNNKGDFPPPVAVNSDLAAPMRHAAAGESGTLIGLDYRGVPVLAAYEPVAGLGWGMVAKIDLAEIRAPFVRAGVLAAFCSVLVIALGAALTSRTVGRFARRLEAEETRYRVLFDGTPDAIFVTDSRTGRVVDVNEQAVRLIGRPRAELIGLHHTQVHPPEMAEGMHRAFQTQAARPAQTEVDSAVLHSDGRRIPVVIVTAEVDLDGRPHLVGFFRDVTDRRYAEQEREQIIAELRAALAEVRTLSGLLPICSACRKVRDDAGYWQHVEHYLEFQGGAQLSHSLCPDCLRDMYPDLADEVLREVADDDVAAEPPPPPRRGRPRGSSETPPSTPVRDGDAR